MPQKVIKFTGINRNISEFQSAGECEELINLRPALSGVKVVKPKKTIIYNADYDVYTHTFGSNSFFIGVSAGDSFGIYLVNEDGSMSLIDSIGSSKMEYSVAFLGNQIVLSLDSETYVYAYEDGKYSKVDAAVPSDIEITYSCGSSRINEIEITTDAELSSSEFKEFALEKWSAAMGQNSREDSIYGPVLVAFNFSMSDGTEFWTNKWMYINPHLSITENSFGQTKFIVETEGQKYIRYRSFPVNFTIKKTQISSQNSKNLVSCINMYASRPVFPYDIETIDDDGYAEIYNMNDSGITNQLLYYQKSIPVSDIEAHDVEFTLDFSSGQAGDRALEVDNGPMKRSGEMVAFNNRIHSYNSRAKIFPQSVVCASSENAGHETRDAYVQIESGSQTIIRKTKALVPLYSDTLHIRRLAVCYPDARATKLFVEINSDLKKFTEIKLTQSPRYNFAYAEVGFPTDTTVEESSLNETASYIEEANAVNVSAPYNPFVYNVENSYSIGGRVLDLATSYLPISSTQIGQYPLTVFTTSGIFSMEQGSGSVLYSNITPVQPQVIEGKAAATPYGTFFISSKNIYVLSGREAVNISSQLNGERELNLREQESYRRLCRNASGIQTDFSDLLSGEDFSEFVSDAHLSYDQLRNELYISSNDENILYSYVFNLDTKAFHKIPKRYQQSHSGARYVIESIGSDRNVVDLHTEETAVQPILLQSRPMSLEAVATHIQRLIFLVDAKLEGSQHLFISVFGSDNLYDWKCIISSQKSKSVLRQIRTNRAGKSYRDYVILINGTVGTDTDLSDIIADYTVVSRRLG